MQMLHPLMQCSLLAHNYTILYPLNPTPEVLQAHPKPSPSAARRSPSRRNRRSAARPPPSAWGPNRDSSEELGALGRIGLGAYKSLHNENKFLHGLLRASYGGVRI